MATRRHPRMQVLASPRLQTPSLAPSQGEYPTQEARYLLVMGPTIQAAYLQTPTPNPASPSAGRTGPAR